MKTIWTKKEILESIEEAWDWWYGMRDECPCCYYENCTPDINSKKIIWPNN